tara:strand:+ start:2125 stop:2805 length:681 start_codon:yes stop_codon:yes gene_type:complete
MSDILPIPLENECEPTEPIAITIQEVKEEVKIEEEVKHEVKHQVETKQSDIFVKEEKEKPRKKRKPMSDEQKEKLKFAREKSLDRRRALSEAKKLQKEMEKLSKKKVMEEKVAKRLEEDEMISFKAKIMNDAKANAGWSEDKLAELMSKTIDNYITKRKEQKPKPRVHIPAQNAYPQYSPHAQQQYLNNNQHNYQAQPAPSHMLQNTQKRNPTEDPYTTLFGYGNL